MLHLQTLHWKDAVTFLVGSYGFTTPLAAALILYLFRTEAKIWSLRDDKDQPKSQESPSGLSFFTIVPFFRERRCNFLNWGFHVTGHPTYRFNLLWNRVIVVSGEKARQAIFANKGGLRPLEPFNFISGGLSVVHQADAAVLSVVQKPLSHLQRNGSLTKLIPLILEDVRKHLEAFGTSGNIYPFDQIYELTFHLTVRALACNEMADNLALVKRLRKLYDNLDLSTTPMTVLFPWLPIPAMLSKSWSAKQIHDIIANAIDERERSGVRPEDTLQMLLDSGDDRATIIEFIASLLTAGARTTGVTGIWMLIFLGAYPEWRTRAIVEIQALLNAHCPAPPSSTSFPFCSEPLSTRLASIPLEAWESETPILDAIIRETTRIAQRHVAMRLNAGPDTHINDKQVPNGAYVAYPFSDIHLDPEVYPDPWQFNPGRKENHTVSLSYVGFGGLASVCAGKRLAKLELKLMTAMFILGFDHNVVGNDSTEPFYHDALPSPNWNEPLTCRPEQTPLYLGYAKNPICL